MEIERRVAPGRPSAYDDNICGLDPHSATLDTRRNSTWMFAGAKLAIYNNRRAARERNELVPYPRAVPPVLRTEASIALLRCGISIRPMSAWGQERTSPA